jgi:two-component system response regulator HydG
MDSKMSVLIIDDDVGFRKSLSRILNKKGYEALEAESGAQAIELVKKRPFGFILMDIKMPAMDGVQTYKKLKEIRSGTTVIMMTAFAVDDLIAEAFKEGVYAILRKPFDMDTVISMIEKAKNGVYLVVVDDDPEFCKSMKQVLEKKGYSVMTCSNGKECVSLAKDRPIDIFFIDMQMPVLNGLETYMELKKINKKAVVVVMTAYRQEMGELVKQAIDNGSYCCLYKPFNMDEAIKIIDEIRNKKITQKVG